MFSRFRTTWFITFGILTAFLLSFSSAAADFPRDVRQQIEARYPKSKGGSTAAYLVIVAEDIPAYVDDLHREILEASHRGGSAHRPECEFTPTLQSWRSGREGRS